MNWYLFILGSSVGKKILMAVTGLCLIGFLAVHLLGNMMAESHHSQSALSHDAMMVEYQAHISVSELDFLVRSLRSSQNRNYKASRFENCQLVRLKLRSLRDVEATVFDKTERDIIMRARKKADEIGCKG